MSAVVSRYRYRPHPVSPVSAPERAERRLWVASGALVAFAQAMWLAFFVIAPHWQIAAAGSESFRACVLALIGFGFPAGMALCAGMAWQRGRESAWIYAAWLAVAMVALVVATVKVGS